MPADMAVHQPSTGIVSGNNDKIPANQHCRHIARTVSVMYCNAAKDLNRLSLSASILLNPFISS